MTSQRVAQAARNLDDTTDEAVPGAVAADAGGQVHDGRGRLDLYFEPAGRKVRVPPGVMLFDAASWNGIAIDSTCGGHGTCRKCKVKVLDGAAPITSLDTRAYTTDELRSGWRLACRVQVATDLRVEVPPLVTRPSCRITCRSARSSRSSRLASRRSRSVVWSARVGSVSST